MMSPHVRPPDALGKRARVFDGTQGNKSLKLFLEAEIYEAGSSPLFPLIKV